MNTHNLPGTSPVSKQRYIQPFLYIVFLFPFLLSACVTMGRFEEMEASRNSLQKTADSLQVVIDGLNTMIDRMKGDSTKLVSVIEDRGKEITGLHARASSLQNDLDNLKQNYDKSKTRNSEEIQKLLNSLEALQKDIYTRETRLRDVEAKLASRDSSLNAVKAKLNTALLGFKDIGLSINIINGKVYVSLSNQLLFSTGRTDIDKRGKEALKELSEVLNTSPDLNILVEGHTDNAQVINLGAIKDNWDLSVMRATEVVRFLTMEGKVAPERITASGRSEYSPIEPGSTPEIRAMNRRTEIILIPQLGELFDIVDTE